MRKPTRWRATSNSSDKASLRAIGSRRMGCETRHSSPRVSGRRTRLHFARALGECADHVHQFTRIVRHRFQILHDHAALAHCPRFIQLHQGIVAWCGDGAMRPVAAARRCLRTLQSCGTSIRNRAPESADAAAGRFQPRCDSKNAAACCPHAGRYAEKRAPVKNSGSRLRPANVPARWPIPAGRWKN